LWAVRVGGWRGVWGGAGVAWVGGGGGGGGGVGGGWVPSVLGCGGLLVGALPGSLLGGGGGGLWWGCGEVDGGMLWVWACGVGGG